MALSADAHHEAQASQEPASHLDGVDVHLCCYLDACLIHDGLVGAYDIPRNPQVDDEDDDSCKAVEVRLEEDLLEDESAGAGRPEDFASDVVVLVACADHESHGVAGELGLEMALDAELAGHFSPLGLHACPSKLRLQYAWRNQRHGGP